MKTSFPKNKHEKMIPRATTYQLSNLRDLVEIGTSSTPMFLVKNVCIDLAEIQPILR